MEIRRGHLTDLPYLYDICLRTGYRGGDATALFGDPYLLGQLFAAPYLVRDPHWCWTAVHDGRPVGYLVATSDTAGFAAWAQTEWVPSLRTLYPPRDQVSDYEAKARGRLDEVVEVLPLAADYPAHLHIDFLPEAQGHGLGTRLMQTFFDQARAEGIPGVHLGVNRQNERALAFYRKLGFATLEDEPWGCVFGMKF